MRKRDLEKYVALIGKEIGLAEWTFEISDGPLTEDYSICEVTPTYRRTHAVFVFSRDFHKASAEERRYLVVHEWVHLFHAQLEDAIKDGIQKMNEDGQGDILIESIDHCIEYAVDRIAKGFEKRLPLPC